MVSLKQEILIPEIVATRLGLKPRTTYSASQELNYYTIADFISKTFITRKYIKIYVETHKYQFAPSNMSNTSILMETFTCSDTHIFI